MLRGTNDDILSKKGLNSIGEIFFYQRWTELLYNKTINTYQYNVLNTHVALAELYEVIQGAIEGWINLKNVSICIEESRELITNDTLIEENCRVIKISLLNHLKTKALEKDPTREYTNKKGPLLRLKYQIGYALNNIKDNYLKWILSKLRDSIISNNIQLVDKYTSFLVSECVYYGWSSQYLYTLKKYFFNQNNFEDKWTKFSDVFLSTKQNLEVYFSFESDKNINQDDIQNLENLGLRMIKGSDIAGKYKCVKNKIDSNKLYLQSIVNTYDYISAVYESILNINKIMNIVTFYNVLDPWLQKKPNIYVINPTNKYIKEVNISDLFTTYDYVDSSLNMLNLTSKALKMDTIDTATILKLNASFMYCNLSKVSFFQEVKYINLWISLESLLKTGQYDYIIDHILNVIPPTLCTRYIYTIIRNFIEDCIRCKISTLNIKGVILNLNTDSKNELVRVLLGIFKNDSEYSDLEDTCTINALLEHRCKEIRHIVKDDISISNELKRHYKKIHWHVYRLYRMRNNIVHSAYQSNRPIIKYIENLYDYLATTVSLVIYYLINKKAASIEEVFAIIIDNYEGYIGIVKEKTSVEPDIIKDGTIDII